MKHVPPPVGPVNGSEHMISRRIAAQERKRQKALQDLAKLRKEASAEIDRLISFLDASDRYAATELEDGADDGPIDDRELEPSFCGVTAAYVPVIGDSGDELEADYGNGLTADDEPSLGFIERHPTSFGHGPDFSGDQGEHLICAGLGGDREDEHDGCEPENEGGEAVHENDEPSLGWPEGIAQGPGSWGGSSDRELAAEPDVRAARRRGKSATPGVGVDRGIVRSRLIGLTPTQKRSFDRCRRNKGRASLVD